MEKPLVPKPIRPSERMTFSNYCLLYGYYIDEMVMFLLNNLPELAGGRHPIIWDPVALRNNVAKMCYKTSINRLKRYRPVI